MSARKHTQTKAPESSASTDKHMVCGRAMRYVEGYPQRFCHINAVSSGQTAIESFLLVGIRHCHDAVQDVHIHHGLDAPVGDITPLFEAYGYAVGQLRGVFGNKCAPADFDPVMDTACKLLSIAVEQMGEVRNMPQRLAGVGMGVAPCLAASLRVAVDAACFEFERTWADFGGDDAVQPQA